jgi:hypothetical protein
MQDAEKADFAAEMLGVGSNFDQRFSATAEQQSVDHFFVLQGQRCQLMREGENDMSIGCGEQLGASSSQPAIARLALALRAVPVAACNGVITITCLMGSIF